ncbi:MAG: hypothetical protein HFJ09_10765 [Lachnospiraceae bacterium]|nr:hypothetical protein [Lachnospiraceae bacterium]
MNIWFYAMLFILLLVLFGMTIFFYRMIKNIIEMIFGEQKNKKVTFLLIAISLGIILFCISIWNIGLLVLLHLMGFILVFSLINLVVKAIAKSNYENFIVWKKLQKCYVLPVISTMLVITYGYWNMYHVVQTNYVVKTQKNIPKEGYRVALLADIHFGVSIDIEGMKEVCEKVEKQNPDIVILCGDIVDENTTYQDMEQVFQVLGAIKSKYGVYYVYGNHDRQKYSGQPAFTNEDIMYSLSKNGITSLQDEKIQITNDLILVGREDASVRNRTPLADLYKEVDKQDFILTLDHQPLEYKINQELGTDLLLSGHTHAGQFFPVNLLMEVIPFGDAVYGVTKNDSFTAIVTAGVAGWKFPIKTSAPAEYVIIEIKS